MRIAVMQPYLFPYLGYFQLIGAVDRFVLLDDVRFIKKGWINRNRLAINGKATRFTVPLEKASQNKLIKDTRISYDSNWQHKILKTIELAYNKAPFFGDVFPMIRQLFLMKEPYIAGLAYHSLIKVLSYLALETEIIASSGIYSNGHLKAQDKILDICLKEHACQYINPPSGIKLYEKDAFAQLHINLSFIKPILSAYRQHTPGFVSGLSIIDVLMYNSRERVRQLLNEYLLE
jgi:hypothetical protein